MKTTKLIMTCSLTVLCACSVTTNTKDTTNPTSPAPSAFAPANAKDITDRSGCIGNSPADITLFKTWHMNFSADGVQFQTTVDIANAVMTMTNTCVFASGYSMEVSVNVPISVSPTQLTIIQDEENTNNVSVGANNYSCSVGIKQASVNYSFAGNCLEIQANGQTAFMNP